MFRALLCSSSGGQNCIIQHLVSPHSVGGRPVCTLRVQKIVRTLAAQNINGRSQNEKDVFGAEVSHALRTGRR